MSITLNGSTFTKRDWELIHQQLTDIEEDRNVLADLPIEPKWTNQSESEFMKELNEFNRIESRILGHIEMLVDNGYVEGIKVFRGADGSFMTSVVSPRLTMSGYDLLDTMRSKTLWNTIKSMAKNKGLELSFDVIKILSAAALKQLVG